MYDPSGRVFIHPSSVLFSESGFKSGYLAYFSKAETSKVFLRDATEVSHSSDWGCKADGRFHYTDYCSLVEASRSIIGLGGSCWVKTVM